MEGVAERLLREALAEAGLAGNLLAPAAARRALARRLKALGGVSAEEYGQRYAEDAGERQCYLEGLLIGETSFFRDAAVFAEMRRWCLQWLAENGGVLRVLSAPCATGEEPYSVAAMLLEAGVPASRFRVVGLDVSRAAVAQAQLGEYRGLALRNLAGVEERWFLEACAGGWRVRDEVRRCVEFGEANLVGEDPLQGARYELICCRNLLIYQTAAARARVAGVLWRGLAEGGRVVLGSADWCAELGEYFELERPARSFALRARGPVVAQVTAVARVEAETTAGIAEHLAEEREGGEHFRAAELAYRAGDERRAEWLCRQALYVEGGHVGALELLARMARPHVSARHRAALRARLLRRRTETGGKA